VAIAYNAAFLLLELLVVASTVHRTVAGKESSQRLQKTLSDRQSVRDPYALAG